MTMKDLLYALVSDKSDTVTCHVLNYPYQDIRNLFPNVSEVDFKALVIDAIRHGYIMFKGQIEEPNNGSLMLLEPGVEFLNDETMKESRRIKGFQ